jgi:hypothetical protein
MFNPGKLSYVVQYKWNLFLFENKTHNIQEYLNKDLFMKLLRKTFTDDKCKIIIDILEDNGKLILDFDKNKAIKVNKTLKSFKYYGMQPYFSKATIINSIDTEKEGEEI